MRAHEGGWDKSAVGAYEVRGKTLGIVGYGNIGSQLAELAEAMGMRVIFYDLTDKLRHGNVAAGRDARTSCWRSATSSACTCRRRRRPSA